MATVVIDKYGTKEYRNDNGQLHREDGPSVIYADGMKEFWVKDELCDDFKPIIVFANGIMLWYKYSLHRTNGPADDRPNGVKEWFNMGNPIWPEL